VAAQSPTPTPATLGFEPYPFRSGTEPSPGGLPWVGTELRVPDGMRLDGLITWSGGFVTLERPEEGPGGSQDNVATAVWISDDGRAWQRTALPAGARRAWLLVALRDALVVATYRPERGNDVLRVGVWRSGDGLAWSRAGALVERLPTSLPAEDWNIFPQDIVEAKGELVLLSHHRCGPGDWRLVAIGAASRGRRRTCPDWRGWGPHAWPPGPAPMALAGAGTRSAESRDAQGAGVVHGPWQGTDGFLGFRLGTDRQDRPLRSPDGLAWTEVASTEGIFESGGAEGLVETAASILLLADRDPAEPGTSGNRLGAWYLETDGTWTPTAGGQRAGNIDQVAMGDTVIVTGYAWDDVDRQWGWTLVSLDAGRSSHPGLSWTGSTGSCVADVVIADGTVAMLGCAMGQPTVWVAPLPGATPSAG